MIKKFVILYLVVLTVAYSSKDNCTVHVNVVVLTDAMEGHQTKKLKITDFFYNDYHPTPTDVSNV